MNLRTFGRFRGTSVLFACWFALLSGLFAAETDGFQSSAFKTFAEWKKACDPLPSNRSIRATPRARLISPLGEAEFEKVVDAFLTLRTTGSLANPRLWVGTAPTAAEFFNTGKLYFRDEVPFQPFAQKLSVPPNAQILFHGDLHGDIRSLVGYLDWLNKEGHLDGFRLVRPETYLIFLGDYTDRGWYGVEVLYTLFRLSVENPDRVVLLRGNHEDISIASRYGFFTEAASKYGNTFNMAKVLRAFDFLPTVLYLGCHGDFIQSHHGGMEPGYNPGSLLEADGALRFQLIGALKQATFLASHPGFLDLLDAPSREVARSRFKDFVPKSPVAPATLGFLWNDFTVSSNEQELDFDPGRAFIYGARATRFILEAASASGRRVRAVFRAHQHSNVINPLMQRLKASNGVFQHWQRKDTGRLLEDGELIRSLETTPERSVATGSVWTFNVSPDSIYGAGCNYNFDAFAILTPAETFDRWKLSVIRLEPK